MTSKNKKLLVLILGVSIILNYVQCAEKPFRARVTDPTIDKSVKSIDDQETSLADAINTTAPDEQEALKDAIVKETFMDAVKIGFLGFQEIKASVKNVHAMMTEIGVEPEAFATEIDEIYVLGTKSVNGLRYFSARYEDAGNIPIFLSFELEPFDGGFDYAKKLMKEAYPKLEEPCFESVDNNVAYKDGDYIISIYEITADNIDLDSDNPPRTMSDVGSVSVSIEVTDEHHGDVCSGDIDEYQHTEEPEGYHDAAYGTDVDLVE